MNSNDTLKNVFGFDKFKKNQEEIITTTLENKNVFVIMGTGSGKSLCYQLPGMVQEGMTIVVSPLLSLINDQVSFLNSKGIKVLVLTSESKDFVKFLNKDISEYKFIYTTPECLSYRDTIKEKIFQLYNQKKINRVVIDEAHCISKWGYDFRPSYLELVDFRNSVPNVPFMLLTASIRDKVQNDIMDQLNLQEVSVFKNQIDRPNLNISVMLRTDESFNEIIELLKGKFIDQTGIIYCFSRKQCETMVEKMKSYNLPAAYYHAGMSKISRDQTQNEWIGGKYKIIVATIAFGMGIDKANVRYVIHYHLPKSLENYYQEIGRAGRDGKPSECILYYNPTDKIGLEQMMFHNKNLDNDVLSTQRDDLYEMLYYAENRTECRHQHLCVYLNSSTKKCCNMCDNCLEVDNIINSEVTVIVRGIFNLLSQMEGTITKMRLILALKGIPNRIFSTDKQMVNFGISLSIPNILIERIILNLILEEYLSTEPEINMFGKWDDKINVHKKFVDWYENYEPFNIKLKNNELDNDIKYRNRGRKQQVPRINDEFQINSNNEYSKYLIELRNEIAHSEGIQPIKVFPNQTLNNLISTKPKNIDDLKNIRGLSSKVIKNHSEKILNCIKSF